MDKKSITHENKTALLVMAAGMGSRYGGIKQLDPVGISGETILEFALFDAIRAGFDELVFIKWPVPVRLVFQETNR